MATFPYRVGRRTFRRRRLVGSLRPADAVAFDAFVVRMAVGPAVPGLLGRRARWLPRSLDRMLPNVDVEGEAPHRAAPRPATAPAAGAVASPRPSRTGGS